MTYTPDNPVPRGVHEVLSADGRHWSRLGPRWYSGMDYTWPGDLEAQLAPLAQAPAPEPEEGPPGGSRAKCLGATLCPKCTRDAQVIREGL
ncbi:hypothetical protein [Streptomyces sp. NRRL B-1347]|uniref:hypothetical protein n=1 Tax=Streptomyces sp. NRRL B-1347 TaxID=1476877 RepID=UPI0004C648D6|nr:hypothetical protein [Streptomyces sp. NRRL B-1347]